MSFLSFFERVGSELKKLFTKTTWEQQAQSVITYVAPLLETIIAFTDPAISAEVNKVISIVQADLATVSAVVSGAQVPAGSHPAAVVKAALGSVQANLTNLLTDTGVKNSANAAKITAIVETINQEVTSMLNGLASQPPAAA